MASEYDTEIRVSYEYIRRQRDGWLNLAPELGRIAGLLRQLQWRADPTQAATFPHVTQDRNGYRVMTVPH